MVKHGKSMVKHDYRHHGVHSTGYLTLRKQPGSSTWLNMILLVQQLMVKHDEKSISRCP